MRICLSYDSLGRYCDVCQKPYLISDEGVEVHNIDFCSNCYSNEECEKSNNPQNPTTKDVAG